MLKLLVADDERILREAVCYLIDWKKHRHRAGGKL